VDTTHAEKASTLPISTHTTTLLPHRNSSKDITCTFIILLFKLPSGACLVRCKWKLPLPCQVLLPQTGARPAIMRSRPACSRHRSFFYSPRRSLLPHSVTVFFPFMLRGFVGLNQYGDLGACPAPCLAAEAMLEPCTSGEVSDLIPNRIDSTTLTLS
jgi:hypothetical protein